MKTKLLILTAMFVAACGGPPAENPLLVEARTVYNKAATDRTVLVHAQVELDQAQDELEKAEMMWRNGEDKVLVDHSAYMAHQRARIAIETARLKTSDDEMKNAELERKQVQLEARSIEAERSAALAEQRRQEADAARIEAENALTSAQRARLEADQATARMQEMTSKLAELEARQTERGIVLTLGDVLFDVGKSTLKSGGARAVLQLSQFMLEYPERRVLIEGHTDNTGSNLTNQRLSERRANAVRDALAQKGVSIGRIETAGLGEDYPVATNSTEAGRQQNRRVEIIISDEKGVIKGR
ncbi:MAG: OmpA family protein [Bacteroidetes bacterium]|nr:OmpA family protein [Bacteroidota bacterium]